MATLSSNPGRDWNSYIDACERAHQARLADGLIPCDGECGEYFLESELKTVDGDRFCIARCYAHERRRVAKARLARMKNRGERAAPDPAPMTAAEAAAHIERFLTLVNTSLAAVYREGGQR